MSWASRRRTTYLTGVILFLTVVIGGPIAYHFLSIAPTCTDGKQNQDETGIDIGGPCPILDARYLQPEAILWSRSFKVRDGSYTAIAAIQNVNKSAGVAFAHYRFSLYDEGNVLVAEREGDTFIMPSALTPVLESRIDTGNRIVAHTYFQFTDPLVWERMGNAASVLSVSGKQLTDAASTPRLSATAGNTSVADVLAPGFVAIVFDVLGNAFAASETRLDRLNAGDSAPIVFTWPSPFPAQVGRIDILPILPPVAQ